jgi:hypothetical protein
MAGFVKRENPRRHREGHVDVLMQELGRFVFVIGLITAFVGLIFWSGFAPKWLGRLPGDIRIERGNFGFYFPIVTCIIISVILTLVFSLFRR